ncbi:helix-loop-helix protein 11-like isoform X2 [Condylostylus longicornis]|uniref:helix-loop-helix protein 11-like isoform X2 n=1 Tax=Condylostylus longicornis TaxID=2530218 RepID=UPI00244DDDBB|nr:helix-loop-helix protein 11-like isoform X2 [Condylostylus longicornis]
MSLLIKSEEIIVDSADYNSDEADEVHLALDDSGGEGYQTVYTETISTQKHSGGTTTTSHQPQQITTSSPRGLRTVTIQQLQNQQNVTGSTITVTKNQNQQSTPIQTSKVMMENEKRLRREIANSNERRRMQSINAGFQSLRSLLPHHEGEKLSKVSFNL